MIYIHLADGFEEIEAITVADVLRRAGITIKTVSMTGKLNVRGAHDISVMADLLFENANYGDCEMIVLPGGMPGTTNLASHQDLAKQIVSFANSGKWVAAICAAPMILGELSLLKGKKATIFPGMEEHLLGAKFTSEKVVVDGNIITSKGPGTAMEFALKLVEIVKGDQMTASLRKAMLV